MSSLRFTLPFLTLIRTPAMTEAGLFARAEHQIHRLRELRANTRERHHADTRTDEQRRDDRKANRKRRMKLRLRRGRGRC